MLAIVLLQLIVDWHRLLILDDTSTETGCSGLIPRPKESYFFSEYDLGNLHFIKGG